MSNETHRWYSERIGTEVRVRVYGHFGQPILVFPTSGGDEREYEGQGMIDALGHHLHAGRVKLFCINSVNNESWYNRNIHPADRARFQVAYDSTVANEILPFIENHCNHRGIAVTTAGASFGAYHALNTLLKHPTRVRRCLALSGVYDLRKFMDGYYDDNFYFNNPVDYMANLTDWNILQYLHQCDIRLATGNGPYEDSGPTRRMAEILASRGVPHHLDDWLDQGGHEWPYWKHQMDVYISRLF